MRVLLPRGPKAAGRTDRWVLLLVLLIFLLGANMAWLNPRPDFEVFRTFDQYPFLWQYNADSGMEILIAADFPLAFESYPQRINRPLYPALVHATGRVIGWMASPVKSLGPLERAGAGYIVVKLVMHLLAGLALVRLLGRWMSPRAALLALALTYLHQHVIVHIATFHTTDLQVLVPILAVWMAVRLQERFSWQRLTAYSLALGLLMLGKQNYAVYAALLGTAIILGRWRESLAGFLIHLAPLALYIAILPHFGLRYSHNEIGRLDQGVWFFAAAARGDLVEIARTVGESLVMFGRNAAIYYSVFLLILVVGPRRLRALGLPRGTGLFLILFAVATWLQFLAVRRFDVVYMTADPAFVIYGISAWMLADWWRLRRWALRLIVVLAGLVAYGSLLHLPYLSPWEQPSRSREKLEESVVEDGLRKMDLPD